MLGRYMGHDPHLCYDVLYRYRIFSSEDESDRVYIEVELGDSSKYEIDYPRRKDYESEWLEVRKFASF